MIVRQRVRNDAHQCSLVSALIDATDGCDPIMLNPVVVAESVWVLERAYKIPPSEARHALSLILETREFHMPAHVATGDWSAWFGAVDCDFSDVLIASLNTASGCSATLIFDKQAAGRVPGMERLT